jgi:lipase
MRLQLHEWGDPDAPPLVCIHGVSAHGRRFRRLAEEHWEDRFHVVAPDLRGHGFSAWEPPWSLAQLVEDLVETTGVPGTWLGHSLGGRLVLELAARYPDLVERAVLLDPAIQLLPNVALDLAQQHCQDGSYGSVEEAIEARRPFAALTPTAVLEEEMSEHLVQGADGRYRLRCARAAVASLYGELSTPPPPPETLHGETLLVYSSEFSLVRDDQLEAYWAALGERLAVVAVPGGHIVFWDAYEDTAGAIDRFLAPHGRE